SRGALETGPGLASRKPIKLDIDNLDAVIARFATTLVLPIGDDGAGVEVPLRDLDDLHPDALYENVDLFQELSALRQQVARGYGAKAIAGLQDWADSFGDARLTAPKRAKGSAVPADRRLSDFQALIGDMQNELATPCPADELIKRVVGPYVQAAPDPAQASMLAAIDHALSGAMRAILHHPDFQTVEATWRSLELLARRVETGAGLEIVLYDVSAEEWAADLSAQEDLAESGLFQMLAEEPRLDAQQGPLSAVFGLYALEETPPHAELMARMAKIAAWMNAPFVSAISPAFLQTRKEDRHPLVKQAWDALSSLGEARYVGLAAPRFLLRLPYGPKTEPIEPFAFEEFTMQSGLRAMLWANPVVLSAILMAQTVTRMGKTMRLGEIMSLGDMPFHYVTDEHGDQVALPCTERLLNTRTAAEVVARGFMPVLSIKGRNEVRQGSFQALGAGELAGPWAPAASAAPAASNAAVEMQVGESERPAQSAPDGQEPEEDVDLFGADSGDASGGDDDPFAFADDDTSDGDDDGDLDALLAGFDDAEADDGDGDGIDPELAALLEDM
ncbi:MAG: type VI secretion system contractile sheath large subunit, partial [Pseudomonadota bacterium]